MRISDWSSDVCSTDLRHLGQVAELECHVARMAGGGGPEFCVLEGMEDRAVAARRLAEDPAPAGAAAAEAAFHQRHHLPDQDVFPGAERGGVDVLVAARSEEHTSELQSLMRIS